jgi:hypothetical protein
LFLGDEVIKRSPNRLPYFFKRSSKLETCGTEGFLQIHTLKHPQSGATPVGNPVTGNRGSLTMTNTLGGASQRFYRLVLVN